MVVNVGSCRRRGAVVVDACLGVLHLPATCCGLRVSFSRRAARVRLSSSRPRGLTWVLTLGTRYALVHLSWVVSWQMTEEGGWLLTWHLSRRGHGVAC